MRHVIAIALTAALVLAAGASWAQNVPCDFVTGGGQIVTTAEDTHGPAKANFGVGGSCKAGGNGHGLWGHLQYIDHGFVTPDVKKLNIHWLTITGYFLCGDPECLTFIDTVIDPPGQPTGTRLICGTARTNLPPPDDTADWFVKVTDNGESGTNSDTFMIQAKSQNGAFTYSSGDRPLAAGNIQLHKPNSSTGFFNGAPTPETCAAFEPAPTFCTADTDCPGGLVCGNAGICCAPGPGCTLPD